MVRLVFTALLLVVLAGCAGAGIIRDRATHLGGNKYEVMRFGSPYRIRTVPVQYRDMKNSALRRAAQLTLEAKAQRFALISTEQDIWTYHPYYGGRITETPYLWIRVRILAEGEAVEAGREVFDARDVLDRIAEPPKD